ncbi:MAG: hypothetical protein GEU78_19095, partial [Actinobacteria bacterium]|nr:hypothetical protein [Actinomycetota bacterium]
MADHVQLDDEARQWQARAHDFANEYIRPAAQREWIADPDERFAWDVIEAGSRAGFRTAAVPPEYGGPNPALSPLTLACVIEEFAVADPGIAICFNHAIKDARAVARIGTQEQAAAFFEEFVEDDRYLTATALTEPEHGSDRWIQPEGFHLETTAVR